MVPDGVEELLLEELSAEELLAHYEGGSFGQEKRKDHALYQGSP